MVIAVFLLRRYAHHVILAFLFINLCYFTLITSKYRLWTRKNFKQNKTVTEALLPHDLNKIKTQPKPATLYGKYISC